MEESKENRVEIERWSKLHAFAMLLATLPVFWWKQIIPLAITGLISFLVLILINRQTWLRFGIWGGAANGLTSFRLLLIFILMLIHPLVANEFLALMGGVILLADGIDGYLARRFQTVSFFGGYYDMETDAFFVLGMSTVLYIVGLVGGWILLIGLTRYAFVLVKIFIKEKKQMNTRSSLGQFIAVFLMGSLISGLVAPEIIYLPLIILAGGMVVFSFMRELVWIIRGNRGVYENA